MIVDIRYVRAAHVPTETQPLMPANYRFMGIKREAIIPPRRILSNPSHEDHCPCPCLTNGRNRIEPQKVLHLSACAINTFAATREKNGQLSTVCCLSTNKYQVGVQFRGNPNNTFPYTRKRNIQPNPVNPRFMITSGLTTCKAGSTRLNITSSTNKNRDILNIVPPCTQQSGELCACWRSYVNHSLSVLIRNGANSP